MQEDVVLDRDSDSKRLHDLGVCSSPLTHSLTHHHHCSLTLHVLCLFVTEQIGATSMEYPGFSFLHGYRSGSHWLDVGEATS